MSEKEYSGGSVSYYKVPIHRPTSPDNKPYLAECNDIIEALHMTYAEGNAFKAIWRSCAARTLGVSKQGYTDGRYDAEKVVFFGERMVAQSDHDARPYLQSNGGKPCAHGDVVAFQGIAKCMDCKEFI
jgi:hypothetical protein